MDTPVRPSQSKIQSPKPTVGAAATPGASQTHEELVVGNGGSSSSIGANMVRAANGYNGAASSTGYGGGYGMGGAGYGGMGGYGMGMGMMGGYGMGMGMMGMGMGMGMNPMLGILNGPMTLIYSLNYLVMSLGQVMEVLGMNAHTIMHLYRTAFEAYQQIAERIRTSETRRWLQRKCKKSRLLRFLLVVASCAVVGSGLKVIQYYFDWRRRKLIGSGYSTSSAHSGGGLLSLLTGQADNGGGSGREIHV